MEFKCPLGGDKTRVEGAFCTVHDKPFNSRKSQAYNWSRVRKHIRLLMDHPAGTNVHKI